VTRENQWCSASMTLNKPFFFFFTVYGYNAEGRLSFKHLKISLFITQNYHMTSGKLEYYRTGLCCAFGAMHINEDPL